MSPLSLRCDGDSVKHVESSSRPRALLSLGSLGGVLCSSGGVGVCGCWATRLLALLGTGQARYAQGRVKEKNSPYPPERRRGICHGN